MIEINHYKKTFKDENGLEVGFSGNIKPFEFLPVKKVKSFYGHEKFFSHKISVRLFSLAQIQELKNFIVQNGYNPFYSLEFGEIVSTSDLYKKNIYEILKEVFDFCEHYNINFEYSTPKTLIDRDFERVYNDAKNFCLKYPPKSIIVNNYNFLKKILTDVDMKNFKIEAGYGLLLDEDFQNEKQSYLKNLSAINLSPIKSMPAIQKFIQQTKGVEIEKKYTVSGCVKVQSRGICPLNDELPTISRISCKAPCHNNFYAIEIKGKLYPFVTDGFCGVHLFENEIEILNKNYRCLSEIGINVFTIDCTAINQSFLQDLFLAFFVELNKYC